MRRYHQHSGFPQWWQVQVCSSCRPAAGPDRHLPARLLRNLQDPALTPPYPRCRKRPPPMSVKSVSAACLPLVSPGLLMSSAMSVHRRAFVRMLQPPWTIVPLSHIISAWPIRTVRFEKPKTLAAPESHRPEESSSSAPPKLCCFAALKSILLMIQKVSPPVTWHSVLHGQAAVESVEHDWSPSVACTRARRPPMLAPSLTKSASGRKVLIGADLFLGNRSLKYSASYLKRKVLSLNLMRQAEMTPLPCKIENCGEVNAPPCRPSRRPELACPVLSRVVRPAPLTSSPLPPAP